jgi:hypothetical protein
MALIQILDVPAQAAFKVSQAARYLGISPNTLKKKAELGLIPAHETEVGECIFLLRDLDVYLISLPSYRSGADSFPSRLTKTGRMSKGDAK